MKSKPPQSPRAPAPDPPPDTADAASALAWLEALAADYERLADLDQPTLRRLREAAGRIAFPERSERRALNARRRRELRQDTQRRDDAALDATSNRSQKRALRFPVPPPNASISSTSMELLERQAATPQLPEALAPAVDEHGAEAHPNARQRLIEPQNCYICKSDFLDLHHHYDSLCPECADFNWQKRTQTADLEGRVALVTGARVKIGYECALMLLRAGASVIVTTRFVCDAARRFEKEADFSAFADRLSIYGLDLRHTPSIEALATRLESQFSRLDFLIHNACQTVRRPPAYYEHLLEDEDFERLPAPARDLLRDYEDLLRGGHGATPGTALVSGQNSQGGEMAGLTRAAGLSQLDLLAESEQAHLFPRGILDGDGQQLDLREGNSWRMELADVPTLELIEVQLVNSIAPFVLTACLKPLMLRVPSRDKHVVNVSAMEGQFYRNFKTTRHPHTNMAKAALNMMTRTSSGEFVKDGIHMNSVDTGWVTDEDPFAHATVKESEQRFAPPLDSVDGAARVVDPIFTGFNSGVHCWGQFLKDFMPTRW